MPTTKPGIQVKTYSLEPDLGLQTAADGPLGGAGPDAQWAFPTYTGGQIEDGSFTADLGLTNPLGLEIGGGVESAWAFPSPAGVELEEGNVDPDLGINTALGDEVVGGAPVGVVWTIGTDVLPEAPVLTYYFVVGTEFGEALVTEFGEMMQVR